MWHNPRLMNLTASALYGVAAFIVFCIAVIALVNSHLFPLKKLQLRGELAHVDAAAVEQVLDGCVKGNFFGVDLLAVREALESIPWVRRVELRRQWPDTLVATVEEHRPLARWSEQELVNTYGERFQGRLDAELPRFVGPAGREATMTAHYRRFAELVAPLGFEIARLELSARQAWRLQLVGKDDARLTVMLGRDQTPNDALNRLRRFVALYPHALAQLGGNVGHVDLRYPNGFALRVPGLEQFETQHKKAGSV